MNVYLMVKYVWFKEVIFPVRVNNYFLVYIYKEAGEKNQRIMEKGWN